MAILTSKGARAPHQLKGRRNVRISHDRRGCGNDDIEQLKDEVNNALAECQKKYYIEGLKDANLATSSGITNSYRVNFDCANIPIARIGVLTVYGYVSDQYSRTTQEYVTNDDSVTTGEKYIRYGMSNDSGTSWTWSDWQKLVTENDLNIFQKVYYSTSTSRFLSNACEKMGITMQKKASFKITLITESGKRCVAYATNYVLNTTPPTMSVIENTTGLSSCLSSSSESGSLNSGGITEIYSIYCELIGLL